MNFRDIITLILTLIVVLTGGFASGWFIRGCNVPKPSKLVEYRDTGSVKIEYDSIFFEKWKYREVVKKDTVKVWDTLFKEFTTPYTAKFDTTQTINTTLEVVNEDSSVHIVHTFPTIVDVSVSFDHPAREIFYRQHITSKTQRVFPIVIYKEADLPWYYKTWVQVVTHATAAGLGLWLGGNNANK